MQTELHFLYEDPSQISTNPFTGQLYETLTRAFRVNRVSRLDLIEGRVEPWDAGATVLSILKQRTWRRMIPFLAHYARRPGVFLYDQDPWEAYKDDASSPGIYPRIASLVPVRAFLVTSPWWARYIHEIDGVPTRFVRMGALPSMCDMGRPFEERPHEVAFQGTVHGHRKAFFERMRGLGIDVKCLERAPFNRFLETVQDVGIFLYDDSGAVRMGGEPTSFHGLWGKCLTVAARGCFVIRNFDLAMEPYGIDELPAVFAFRDEAEVPSLVKTICAMSPDERRRRIEATVSRIRERDDWMTVVEALRAE